VGFKVLCKSFANFSTMTSYNATHEILS
jgi:hypothetical protein